MAGDRAISLSGRRLHVPLSIINSAVGRCAIGTLILSTAVTSSDLAVAGGGGTGSKSNQIVKVRNVFPANPQSPLVSIDTVPIGDPDNQAASVAEGFVGSVPNHFRMGRFEVTVADYAAFLNGVATRGDGPNSLVVESLYDARMESDVNIAGIRRIGAGTEVSPYSYVVIGDPKKPIAYVTWFNAARFANWIHNGASTTADIETGAYSLNGALSGTIWKNQDAVWWIPSQDEWFKAAYYKAGGANAGYWGFPTQSDSLPGNSAAAEGNQANFQRLGVFSVTQSTTAVATENCLTAVGTFINSPSAYGTFDQGGNLEEWTDTVMNTQFGEARITRGGAWNSGGLNNDVATIPTALPSDRSAKVGFRLARAAILEGGTGSLSGTFLVRVGSESSSPRTIKPGEVAQFAVRRGNVTVFAADALIPTIAASKQFSTANRRTIPVTVGGNGGTIVLGEDAAG